MDNKGCVNSPVSLSLKGRLKFLFRDSALYGGAAAASKLFSLFTFPVLARCYSTSDYGIIDAFTVLAGLLTVLIIFGQDSAVARYFYEYDDMQRRRQLISQSLLIQVIFLIIAIPILWTFADTLTAVYTKNTEYDSLSRLVIAQVPFALLINFSQNLLKWTFKRFQFLFISIGSTVFSVGIIIVGVLVFKIDIVVLFWLYLLSRVVFSAIGMYFCRAWIEMPRGVQHVKELLHFGIPYGVLCALGAFIPALDRAFISRFLSAEALGLYAAGYKVAFLINLPVQAFQTAWGPFSLSIFKEENASETYNHVLVYFSVFICLMILLVSFLAEPLLSLLASYRYSSATTVVFPLILGIGIQSIAWIPGIGIDLSKKSYLNVYCAVASVITTMAMIWLLIKPFGIGGVAYGVCAGIVLKSILQTWLASISYPLRFSLKKPLMIVILCIAAGIVGIYSTIDSALFAIGTRSLILIIFLFMVWFLVFTGKERAYVLKTCRLVINS